MPRLSDVEKAAGCLFIFALGIIVVVVGLLGWGFVEIVNWVTEK